MAMRLANDPMAGGNLTAGGNPMASGCPRGRQEPHSRRTTPTPDPPAGTHAHPRTHCYTVAVHAMRKLIASGSQTRLGNDAI